MIEPVQIAINRYAPSGAESINMYSIDGEQLALGQLIAAVCIKAGANYEAQSVMRANAMNANTENIKTASQYLQGLAEDTVNDFDWLYIRSWLIFALEIPSSGLPTDLKSYAKRFQAINSMKTKMEALTRQAQEDMIELQSLINQRDVSYTTGTSVIKELGSSQNNTASNY
ncbi:MAG: hypothetical protein IKP00_12020 [Victivallales bacterium]|nr:hypothetical protein [Victivallales bacterium]